MNKTEDPRLAATRALALDAALSVLQENGVLAVTPAGSDVARLHAKDQRAAARRSGLDAGQSPDCVE